MCTDIYIPKLQVKSVHIKSFYIILINVARETHDTTNQVPQLRHAREIGNS